MRFSEPARMADDGEHSPVWARTRRRSGNPIVGILVTLLALFGVLTAVLGIKEQSLAEGGAMMDGWISKGVSTVRGVIPGAAGEAAEAAEAAAETAGATAPAATAPAADEMKKQ
jgi:hypothetical protein